MKDTSEERFLLMWSGGIFLFLVVLISTFIVLEYDNTRDQGINEYRKVLENNLHQPDIKNLTQIRGGLRQWIAGYEELKVPTNYAHVYNKVEGVLAEADALAERFPTMGALEFQSKLSLLQGKVHFVPPISADLYGERNPWFPGFLSFVFFGALKFAALAVVMLAGMAGAVYLAEREGKPKPTSSASTAGTESGGGGSGGYIGPGGYPGVYDDTWRYPPPSPPPTYRYPPYG